MDNYIFSLDPRVERTNVNYKNRFGITIDADLYLSKENRPAPWDWEKTQFPNVQHHFKSENKPENNPQPTAPTTDTAVDDESLPF